MRRLFACFFACLMLLSLTACGSAPAPGSDGPSQPEAPAAPGSQGPSEPEPEPQPEQKPEPEPQQPKYVRGDVNGDGKIDEADTLAIQKHITDKSPLKGVSLEASDLNGDGRVNSLDVLFIKKHIEGKYSISG